MKVESEIDKLHIMATNSSNIDTIDDSFKKIDTLLRDTTKCDYLLIMMAICEILIRDIFVNEINNEMVDESEFEFENIKCEL